MAKMRQFAVERIPLGIFCGITTFSDFSRGLWQGCSFGNFVGAKGLCEVMRKISETFHALRCNSGYIFGGQKGEDRARALRTHSITLT